MTRLRFPNAIRSRRVAAILLFALAPLFAACDRDEPAASHDALTAAYALLDCPSRDIDAFVAAFAEDPALQRAFSADVVETAYIDWSAKPEPVEVSARTAREHLAFPLMPGRDAQRRDGLVYRRVSLAGERATVALERPDSDAQLLYTFESGVCWRLVKVVDPAFAKAKATDAKTVPTAAPKVMRTCGGTTLALSYADDGSARTLLRMTGSGGERVLRAPDEMRDYTAIGIGCAVAADGAPYFIVEYGEHPQGCEFCEWRYLYDADGKRLNASDPILLVDPGLPPAYQQYPNNIDFDRRAKALGLRDYPLSYL